MNYCGRPNNLQLDCQQAQDNPERDRRNRFFSPGKEMYKGIQSCIDTNGNPNFPEVGQEFAEKPSPEPHFVGNKEDDSGEEVNYKY